MLKTIEVLNRIKSVIGEENYKKGIQIHEPSFKNSNALNYLKDCIDTGWVSSSGKWVSEFESLIKNFTGAKYAIAVSNGTVALRLGLFLVGVRSNEEVLIPPLSFVATANSISHLGALPHFIDIEPDSLGMCPIALEKRLNEIAEIKGKGVFNKLSGNRIAAVMPVHAFGLPAKIIEIKKICSKWNLPIVEDAAEALGSGTNYSGKFTHCGCFGQIGILSFNGNKIITTGGGGVILTNNEELGKLAKHLSTTAKVDHPWNFFHDQIAWNDRLPNINAAIGCSQMEKLKDKLKLKRNLHLQYKNCFKDIEEVEIIDEDVNCKSNYWLVTMRLKGKNTLKFRDEILQDAHNLKIFLRPSWILLNHLPMYKESYMGDLTEALNQSKRLINLPSSPQLINKN